MARRSTVGSPASTLRVGATKPAVAEAVGAGAEHGFGAASDRFTWEGEAAGLRYGVALWLHPCHNLWLWRVNVENAGARPVACDAALVQDIGLGNRGFVMRNEAYVSQYVDHRVVRHARCGPVVTSRQNLAQGTAHPWVAHGCLEGALAFATDAMQARSARFIGIQGGSIPDWVRRPSRTRSPAQ